MAGRPKRRARRNPGKKTYAQLLTELKWLGPAVVVSLMEAGGTRQCGSAAQAVAYYLQEKGFAARTDAGAGRYFSHFDLAVYTTDRGWISVDPTAIQFHAPINESHAYDMAMKDLPDDRVMWTPGNVLRYKGPRAEADALTAQYFEPTIQWSVRGLREGLPAFEIAEAPHIRKPAEVLRPPTPLEWNNGVFGEDSWQEHWGRRRKKAMKLLRGELPSARFYSVYDSYWAQEVARRLGGRR